MESHAILRQSARRRHPSMDLSFLLAFQFLGEGAILRSVDTETGPYFYQTSTERLIQSIRHELLHFHRHESRLIRLFGKLEFGSAKVKEVCLNCVYSAKLHMANTSAVLSPGSIASL